MTYPQKLSVSTTKPQKHKTTNYLIEPGPFGPFFTYIFLIEKNRNLWYNIYNFKEGHNGF